MGFTIAKRIASHKSSIIGMHSSKVLEAMIKHSNILD